MCERLFGGQQPLEVGVQAFAPSLLSHRCGRSFEDGLECRVVLSGMPARLRDHGALPLACSRRSGEYTVLPGVEIARDRYTFLSLACTRTTSRTSIAGTRASSRNAANSRGALNTGLWTLPVRCISVRA